MNSLSTKAEFIDMALNAISFLVYGNTNIEKCLINFMTRTKVVSTITLSERGIWSYQIRIIESTIKLEYIIYGVQ